MYCGWRRCTAQRRYTLHFNAAYTCAHARVIIIIILAMRSSSRHPITINLVYFTRRFIQIQCFSQHSASLVYTSARPRRLQQRHRKNWKKDIIRLQTCSLVMHLAFPIISILFGIFVCTCFFSLLFSFAECSVWCIAASNDAIRYWGIAVIDEGSDEDADDDGSNNFSYISKWKTCNLLLPF